MSKASKKEKPTAAVLKANKAARKKAYFDRMTGYLETYSKVMLISVDNVGAAQLQKTRKQFRGTADVLMGKNTMMRKCMRQFIDRGNKQFQPLMDAIYGNVGLVFTNGDLRHIRNEVTAYRVPAPAKSGVVAPSDVIIPAGPTGLEPTATSFLQALNIPSKIVKGQIELTNAVHLIRKGDKVKPGAAALLQKLKITPFSYGIDVATVYNNGFVYGADLLDLTDRDVLERFARGLSRIAALGLRIGYPTLASVPHSIANAYQNLLAIGIGTEYTFGPVTEIKARIANPGAFVQAPVAQTGGHAAAAAPAAAAAVVEEKEASEEEEMDMDLFG